jgi:hypothetical protein
LSTIGAAPSLSDTAVFDFPTIFAVRRCPTVDSTPIHTAAPIFLPSIGFGASLLHLSSSIAALQAYPVDNFRKWNDMHFICIFMHGWSMNMNRSSRLRLVTSILEEQLSI